MQNQKQTQKQIILDHLRRDEDITLLTAIGVYRIFNLKARINELRDMGFNISTTMKRDNTNKAYASYSLEES